MFHTFFRPTGNHGCDSDQYLVMVVAIDGDGGGGDRRWRWWKEVTVMVMVMVTVMVAIDGDGKRSTCFDGTLLELECRSRANQLFNIANFWLIFCNMNIYYQKLMDSHKCIVVLKIYDSLISVNPCQDRLLWCDPGEQYRLYWYDSGHWW